VERDDNPGVVYNGERKEFIVEWGNRCTALSCTVVNRVVYLDSRMAGRALSNVVVAGADVVVLLSLRLKRLWNVQTRNRSGGLAGIIFGKVWAFKRCE
jgi:hypothetical protein